MFYNNKPFRFYSLPREKFFPAERVDLSHSKLFDNPTV